jgi:hypothetical protein
MPLLRGDPVVDVTPFEPGDSICFKPDWFISMLGTMNISLLVLAKLVCIVGIIGAIVVNRMLPRHVDPERLRSVSDPARSFSSLGPSYEVLSDRGRRLLSISYILAGGGVALAMVLVLIQPYLRS